MTLVEIVSYLSLNVETPGGELGLLDKPVTGGYVSDLLSDVMANAQAGDIWVTSQTHQNVAAVASLLEVAAVVLVGGLKPDDDTLIKASANQVVIFTTEMSAFDLVGQLYQMGIRGGTNEP